MAIGKNIEVDVACTVCYGIDETCQNCGGSGYRKMPLADAVKVVKGILEKISKARTN